VTPERTPPPQPTFTKERTTAALATKSFALLVSYTDQGFEPSHATVHVGDMVRFTNNSTKPMWITHSNYPAAGKSCGTSALDTCKALPPGEYWEFTFTSAGTWTFSDKTSGALGSLLVK
jgi:plastocyanin